MQLYPTRSTFHVAVAGIGLVTLGAAARLPPVVAFGGAMLLAVAFGRAMARLGITRLRAAGFEMVWADAKRVHRLARGATIVVRGELRNRSDVPMRVVALRVLASSWLEVSVGSHPIDLRPASRAIIEIAIHAKRVGRWGVHGLALEVSATPFGADGLYEVPLLFANPLGIEVFPPALHAFLASPRGGRARRAAEGGRRRNASGDGNELRELRDHAYGDPFRRIAWKASARRARLLVREMERDERDVVWLVVDASVELWAGPAGESPLDRVIDEVAATSARHLAEGDRVGLVILASRLRSWIDPNTGAPHGALIAGSLASAASVVDADRSELDEADVARRVGEHARPLDPRGLADVRKGDLDALALRASQLLSNAPFSPRRPQAPTPREETLRHYLAAFGIESPPRTDGERVRAETTLGSTLERLRIERPRPSIVHVWAPPPAHPETMGPRVTALRARGAEVRWTLPPFDAGIRHGSSRGGVATIAEDAVRVRARVTGERGERILRKMGVRVFVHGASMRRSARARARAGTPA
jgi:uncharacterized protein (DUF58 family)